MRSAGTTPKGPVSSTCRAGRMSVVVTMIVSGSMKTACVAAGDGGGGLEQPASAATATSITRPRMARVSATVPLGNEDGPVAVPRRAPRALRRRLVGIERSLSYLRGAAPLRARARLHKDL